MESLYEECILTVYKSYILETNWTFVTTIHICKPDKQLHLFDAEKNYNKAVCSHVWGRR